MADKLYIRNHFFGILFLSVVMVIFWRYPEMDFFLTDLFFDSATGQFPAKKSWFWRTVMHDGVSQVSKIAQASALLTLVGSFFVKRLKPYRVPLAYFVCVSLLSSALIGWLKNSSDRACPDDLLRYGGTVEFSQIFSGIVEMAGNKCWPGGHILHALALLPLPFALRGMGWQRASGNAMIAVVIFAFLLNYTQLIRGQHFLSHHLWTLWVSWTLAVAAYAMLVAKGKFVGDRSTQ